MKHYYLPFIPKAEIDYLMKYLPEQLSEEEVKEIVLATIAETGAAGMKDMGKIMGTLKTKYAGQLDMGKANGIIKNLLS